jgi:hypothetical protein
MSSWRRDVRLSLSNLGAGFVLEGFHAALVH